MSLRFREHSKAGGYSRVREDKTLERIRGLERIGRFVSSRSGEDQGLGTDRGLERSWRGSRVGEDRGFDSIRELDDWMVLRWFDSPSLSSI